MPRIIRRPWFWLLPLFVAGAGFVWYARPSTPPDTPAPAAEEKSFALPEEEREYLWQVEHHGNLLVKHGFVAVGDALKRGDGAALARLFAADFVGEVYDRPDETRTRTDLLDVVRLADGDTPPVRLGREAFVARLMEFRAVFGKPPGVKMSLMGLSPVERDHLDGPWHGTAQLRLWGEREPGKPGEVIAYLQYRVPKPTAENLARPGWLASCRLTQSQVGKAQGFLFRESAKARGIDAAQFHDNWKDGCSQATHSGGVYVCDYDRDGWLDVLVTDLTGVYLYKGGPGGTFRNVTLEVGLPEMLRGGDAKTTAAAFVDLDGDGWEDLILGDSVYRNEGGRRFVNVTARCNFRLPDSSTGVAIADFDRDGLPDLYVTRYGLGKASSWLSGESGFAYGNTLLRNKGNFQFEDVTAKSGTDGGHRSTFSAVWLDVNNDGWPDLYVPNEFGNGVLYVNQQDGTFKPAALADRPCDFGTMAVTAGDVNNDGNIDIYCANMYSKAGSRVMGNLRPDAFPDAILSKMKTFVRGSQLHLNKGGLGFEQKGKEWQLADCGWAYGAALADFDNDGWLDLHATAGFISKSRGEPDG